MQRNRIILVDLVIMGFLVSSMFVLPVKSVATPFNIIEVESSSLSFPLGIYWPLKTDDIDKAQNIGLDTVIFGYDTNISLEETPAYSAITLLNHCQNIGMNVVFELSYFLRWNDLEHLHPNITLLREYSCISTWYLVDEPAISQNGTRIDENAIFIAHNIVRSLDDRPTFVQFSNQFMDYIELYDAVPDFVDIISVDPYPFSGNRSKVATWLDSLNEYNMNRAIMWTVLQAHTFNHSPQYYPTADQFLTDAVLALQRNVTGLLWFTFGDYNISEIPMYGPADSPVSWEAFGNLIYRIRHIMEYLNSSTENSPIFQQDLVSYAYRTSSNGIALFIANHNYTVNGAETFWHPTNVSISIPRNDINHAFVVRPWGLESLPHSHLEDGIRIEVDILNGAILLLTSESYLPEFTLSFFFGILCYIITFFFYLYKKRIDFNSKEKKTIK
ncbi:MAG: hypothetical protein ACFFCQ_01970 [Promethearchaeota archaeon]